MTRCLLRYGPKQNDRALGELRGHNAQLQRMLEAALSRPVSQQSDRRPKGTQEEENPERFAPELVFEDEHVEPPATETQQPPEVPVEPAVEPPVRTPAR